MADQIERYIHNGVKVCSGFIVGPGTENISPEIDVMVADLTRCPPLLNESGVCVLSAESVQSVIEVKSSFTGTILGEVFEHLREVLRVVKLVQNDVWIGAFFYTKDGVYEDLASRVAKECAPLVDEGLLPTTRKLCVAIMNDSLCFLDNSNAHPRPHVKRASAGAASFSLAIADLLGFSTNSTGRLDELVERMTLETEIAEVPST